VPSPTVLWFRRDLRLGDHAALAAAAAEGGDVVALFVVDPLFTRRAGGPRRAFLHDCLRALDEATGGALVVRHGDPTAVVPAVAAEVGASTVFVTKDFGPYGRERDGAVADALRAAGRSLRGVGSPYAVEPGTVRKQAGGPYAVFSPFARAWTGLAERTPVGTPTDVSWAVLPSDGLPERPDTDADLPDAGEAAALARWRTFRDEQLDDYGTVRNLPGVDGTSHLSPHLRWGTIHPRTLLADIGKAEAGSKRTFVNELAWREFYADVLFHQPRTARENLNPSMDAMRLDTDAGARRRFERWATGTTGFPIVDAGMRQMLATGWMHNRIRMVTASFLVKDLHLPWQWGARHFMLHLVDGDLASNGHGWQWTAGTGTDAAPYFRVFNPSAQQEKFDPDGAYVARWVPEAGTDRYPDPMVDHAAERAEALARYNAIPRREQSVSRG
jgi:deoxyribodipyrimidine photo-lyase